MEGKYQNKYNTSSTRLQGWDYGSHGLYFVTICTKDRMDYLGEIRPSDTIGSPAYLEKTEIGNVAYHNWTTIPEHFPFVELDDFVIMPDHMHGILFINNPDKNTWTTNKFGPQSKNLGSIIRGFKASVKTYATTNNTEFVWQPRFHDRIIRDKKEHDAIRQYIFDNPDNWLSNGKTDIDTWHKI